MCFGDSKNIIIGSFSSPSPFIHTCEMLIKEQDFKEQLYKKVSELSAEYSGSMRLSGLGIGIATAILTLVFRIASIGEAVIKGLANIFGAIAHLCGAPNCEEFNFFSGVKQILIGIPGSLLNAGIWMPLEIIVVDILANSIQMLINPETWPEGRSQSHFGRKNMWEEITTVGETFKKGRNLEKVLQVIYGP